MFEPALMLLVFSACPKVGGAVTCGRFGGGGTSLGGRLILPEKPTCPTPTSCSTPPEMSAICPSATVTYTPGGGRSGGALCPGAGAGMRSEEHTSELQSHLNLVCRLLLE